MSVLSLTDVATTSLILLALLTTVSCYRPHPDPGPDIPHGKPFCGTRWPATERCCQGRRDRCTVPILDTICYCDEFCDRTISDCCPDYWNLCLGLTWPPTTTRTTTTTTTTRAPQQIVWTTRRQTTVNNCVRDGVVHQPGDRVTINCNNCSCVADGDVFNWRCSQVTCLIQTDVIDHVNTGKYGWRAANHSAFWGLTLDDGIQYRLGTFRPLRPVDLMTSLRVFADDVLPESFDARVEWPGLIGQVDDQGNCAASWAFSTTGVAADRIRIASAGKLRDSLSAQQLISCNHNHLQRGCQGGHLDRAWWYMRHYGLALFRYITNVLNGTTYKQVRLLHFGYGSWKVARPHHREGNCVSSSGAQIKLKVTSADCYPYTSGKTDVSGPCLMPRKLSTTATVSCPKPPPATSRVYQATPPYRIAPKEREIMKELMDNGPVQATMEVRDDFFMYRSGVYRHTSPLQQTTSSLDNRSGFHSVRIIGWGTDRTVSPPLKYWLCVNSWGRAWGEDGYFRIQRGTDESNIESFVVGVWGKVSGRVLVPRRTATRVRPQAPRTKRVDSLQPTFNNILDGVDTV